MVWNAVVPAYLYRAPLREHAFAIGRGVAMLVKFLSVLTTALGAAHARLLLMELPFAVFATLVPLVMIAELTLPFLARFTKHVMSVRRFKAVDGVAVLSQARANAFKARLLVPDPIWPLLLTKCVLISYPSLVPSGFSRAVLQSVYLLGILSLQFSSSSCLSSTASLSFSKMGPMILKCLLVISGIVCSAHLKLIQLSSNFRSGLPLVLSSSSLLSPSLFFLISYFCSFLILIVSDDVP